MMTHRTDRPVAPLLALLALVAVVATPAAAQETSSLGWAPWIGCWEADSAPEGAALCIRPADDQENAVEILRVEDGEILERELVWADGARHETIREECEGWEEGRFSQDGRRLFLNSEHTCESGLVQRGGGIMALAGPDEWLDVRYLEVGDAPSAWVQRYTPAPLAVAQGVGLDEVAELQGSMRARGARVAAAQAPDVEDVIEASSILPAEPVEAWVAETGRPFGLDARDILAMDEAGVPDQVVDIVVAVSNPDVFALHDGTRVEERDFDDRGRPGYRPDPRGRVGIGWYDPFYYGSFRYGSRYSPFGYGYGSYWGYQPSVVIVDRRDGGSSGGGRVIAGQGYRGPRSSMPGSGSGSSARGSSGSGSGASAAPPSRGSDRGSTGRKAKPRPPGGKDDGGGR